MDSQIRWNHAECQREGDILTSTQYSSKVDFFILHLSLMECQVRWDHAGWCRAPRCLEGTFYGQFGVNTAQPD